jgi:hypothetical protein
MTPEQAWEATGQLECLDEDVGTISITRNPLNMEDLWVEVAAKGPWPGGCFKTLEEALRYDQAVFDWVNVYGRRFGFAGQLYRFRAWVKWRWWWLRCRRKVARNWLIEQSFEAGAQWALARIDQTLEGLWVDGRPLKGHTASSARWAWLQEMRQRNVESWRQLILAGLTFDEGGQWMSLKRLDNWGMAWHDGKPANEHRSVGAMRAWIEEANRRKL